MNACDKIDLIPFFCPPGHPARIPIEKGFSAYRQQRFERAIACFEVADELLGGHPLCRCNLARLCELANYPYDEVMRRYAQSALLHCPDALYWMGMYCQSNPHGLVDDGDAVYWFESAALQGDLRAQYRLARCYATGCGVERDRKKALYWLRRVQARQPRTDLRIDWEIQLLEQLRDRAFGK